MGEEQISDDALTPDQVREAQQGYRERYGDGAFQTTEQPAAPIVQPEARTPLITSGDIPKAPFIEPEGERTKTPAEVEEMRREYEAHYGEQ